MAGGHAWQRGGSVWHTVNDRSICILLECILVTDIFKTMLNKKNESYMQELRTFEIVIL